jgi:uncharacterized protein (DUF2164 family)
MKKIELPKEVKKQAVSDIKEYFSKEMDQQIGDLSADLMLDFILENIGPAVYNQAIKDAYLFLSERVEDLYSLERNPRP